MFRSENFIFRNTALGEALVKAGVAQAPVKVREAKFSGRLRQRQDPENVLPSVDIDFTFVA